MLLNFEQDFVLKTSAKGVKIPPNMRQTTSNRHVDSSQLSYYTMYIYIYICSVISIEQSMFERGSGVGNPVVNLLCAGLSSHCDNVPCTTHNETKWNPFHFRSTPTLWYLRKMMKLS